MWWLPHADQILSSKSGKPLGHFPNDSEILRGCKQPCSMQDTAILPSYYFHYQFWDDGTVSVNESVSQKGDIRYNAMTYCVDRLGLLGEEHPEFNEYVLSLCPCASTLCLYKCCPLNMELNIFVDENGNEQYNCQYKSQEEAKDWYPLGINQSFHLLYGIPTCEIGEEIVLPNDLSTYPNSHILSNGSMQIIGDKILVEKLKFCGENIVYKRGNSEERLSQILRCYPRSGANGETKNFKRLLYGYLSIVGVVFLALTLAGIFIRRREKTVGDLILSSQLLVLIIGYVCISISFLAVNHISHSVCILLGFITFYSFLSSFFWLNSLCIDLAWTFSELRMIRQISNRRFVYYSVYSWLGPAVIVFAAIIVDFTPGLPANVIKPAFTSRCWFPNGSISKLAYFYGPISVLLVSNIFLFLFTTYKIWYSHRSSFLVRNKEQGRQRLMLYLKIFCLMGLTWLFEVISWAVSGSDYYWLGTDLINILRAVFIFIIICCKRQMISEINERLCRPSGRVSQRVTEEVTIRHQMSSL